MDFIRLKQLVDLQELDNHINRIETELADIPRQIEIHRSKLNNEISESKVLQHQQETLTKERHAKELDLKSREDEIRTFNTQLYSVKTNEQYKAIQHEIADVKSKISKLEDDILVIMESLDKTKEILNKKKVIIQQEETRFKEVEQKFKTEIQRLEELLKEAEKNRTKLVESIEPDLLRIYNRISSKWSGSALATVKGYVCQGCSMTLPAQVIAEVRKNDRIVQCENCSRILYVNESEIG